MEARGKRFGREGINSTTINAISKNSNSHDDNINSNTNSSSNEENNIITTTTDKLIELSGKSYYTKIKNINNVKFINFYNFDINQNDYNQTDSNCYQKLQLQNSKGNIQKNTPPEEEEEIYIHESVDLYNHQLFLMI